MNVNYKMMGVVLCGAMLLASGYGAKAETTASSAVESNRFPLWHWRLLRRRLCRKARLSRRQFLKLLLR